MWERSRVKSSLLPKLDFCNALFHNIPKYKKKQLQKVQSASAGLVMKKYRLVSDVLPLNWLPTEDRLQMEHSKTSF